MHNGVLLLVFCYAGNILAQTTRIDRARAVAYGRDAIPGYHALFELFDHRYSMSVDSLEVYLGRAKQIAGDSLVNMKERARESDLELTIKSVQGMGTVIGIKNKIAASEQYASL